LGGTEVLLGGTEVLLRGPEVVRGPVSVSVGGLCKPTSGPEALGGLRNRTLEFVFLVLVPEGRSVGSVLVHVVAPPAESWLFVPLGPLPVPCVLLPVPCVLLAVPGLGVCVSGVGLVRGVAPGRGGAVVELVAGGRVVALGLLLELAGPERRGFLGVDAAEVRGRGQASVPGGQVGGHWLGRLPLGWVQSGSVEPARVRRLRELLLRLLGGLAAREVLRLYRVAELGVRDLRVCVHVDSPHQRHQLVLQRVVAILLEEDAKVVNVDFAFVLGVDSLKAAER